MCLPPISSTGDVTSPSASIPASAISTTPPLYETPTPPPPPPPHPFSKPPITRFFTRRPKIPTELPSSSPTSASPDTPVVDASNNNIDESHIVSDELQTGPRYNLRDRSTIHPEDKYGFPRVNALVHEPVTYQEAAGIPEWQLAMSEELAALDRI